MFLEFPGAAILMYNVGTSEKINVTAIDSNNAVLFYEIGYR